jgi:NAD(P)-dependent dehydrogenase (short-subunit alcohol dehydrogenase family)
VSGFAAKYGPWAVVAGASEGVGLELARKVAAKGVHCILIARREGPLAEVAERIRSESGVECVPASVDLAAPDAFDPVLAAVGSREVGLERLPHGPVYAWVPLAGLYARWSRLRVRATTAASRKVFGADPVR